MTKRNNLLAWAAAIGLVLLWALLTGQPAHAQNVQFPIGTGSASGSYHKLLSEVKTRCDRLPIQLVTSAGSSANLDGLEANSLAAAMTQADALALYGQTRDMSNVQVLTPMYMEQIHFVTRANLGQKAGGFSVGSFQVGGKDVVLNTVEDLQGQVVAAAGGSYVTAQVLRLQGQLNMQLTEEASADNVVKGVLAGKYAAGILVGAQPLGTLTAMGANMASLKLLPVTEAFAARVKLYADKQSLTYRQMGPAGTNVRTLGVPSVLVVQSYRKGPMAQIAQGLRQCIEEAADDMAQTPGTHPAWRTVGKVSVNWPMWPGIQAPAVKK